MGKNLPLTAKEKRDLRRWASKRDAAQLACRTARGSHWWPDITSEKVTLEWDPKEKRYNLVGACQRGCGCKAEYPVARKTGIVGQGRIIYPEGYQWSEEDGNPGGPMSVQAKGLIRLMQLEEKLVKDPSR